MNDRTEISGPLTVLGVETSCDETAAAVVRLDVDGNAETLADVVLSQTAEHALYGGVVPELAARAHVSSLDRLIARAMEEAGLGFDALDAVAATAGPGLVGGLLVGVMTAKAIAIARGLPFIAVNHLEGHALTPGLTHGLQPPYLLLLVSGGHTQIVAIKAFDRYEHYGATIDDALGEAFDKTAKLLNLGYPGGPAVEAAAREGDAARFVFPRPLVGTDNCNFSFSGLKTAVRQRAEGLGEVTAQDVSDISAGFQAAIGDCLVDRLGRAMDRFDAGRGDAVAPMLVVAGGVAANLHVRDVLERLCDERQYQLIVPPVELCTDNAAMIAYVGALHARAGQASPLDISVRARWPLDEHGEALPFAGKKA